MKIRIQYFASIRELLNLREEIIEVPEGADVKNLLGVLVLKHGQKLKEYLFDETGNLRPYLQFIVNEESISKTGGLSTVLKNNSVFAVIPPVGGG